MSLPKDYAWLARETGPKMLVAALALYGTQEKPGAASNPIILAWAQEIGGAVAKTYSTDSIPWCALFMSLVAKRAGKPLPPGPLWARAWAEWGDESPVPALGDVLVFSRSGAGHVGLYVGEDSLSFHVLGGNQGDAVCIKRVARVRLLAARRCYRLGVPANVRPVILGPHGSLSRDET